ACLAFSGALCPLLSDIYFPTRTLAINSSRRERKSDMKRIYILTFVLLVMGFVRGDASVTRAQDPLVVNSKTIVLKLENSRVRVLEATLKPGDQEQTHSHPAYVIYVIAGGKVRNHAADGTVT